MPPVPNPPSDLAARDLPRERLRQLGPRALTLPELLTAVLGSGGSGLSAAQIAHHVLRAGGEDGLRGVARLSMDGLARVEGMGPAKAARILAALELGRRAASEEGRSGVRIRGPEDVHRRMGPHLRDRPQEEFHALLLNTQHVVLREVLVTRGILDASLIHPREVFRPAVEAGAAAVILVHNHPSGDPTPSAEDRAVTRQLQEAGRTLGIPVLDHVVIGNGSWRSVES